MSTSPDPLDRFRDAALRVAAATDLKSVELGAVYVVGAEDATLLALRVVLTAAAPGPPDRFPAQPAVPPAICAFARIAPLSELHRLIEQLARGEISTFVDPIHVSPDSPDRGMDPVAIRTPAAGKRGEQAGDAPFPGFYSDQGTDRMGQAALHVGATGKDYGNIFQEYRIEAPDRLVALASDYQIPSLGRLIRRYTHLNGDGVQNVLSELSAPWPIQTLEAQAQGRRGLRLVLRTLPRLDRDCLVINVEGADTDRRIDPNALRWIESPSADGGFCTLVGLLDDTGTLATAVNVFFRGVPEVALRSRIPEAAWNRPAANPFSGVLQNFGIDDMRAEIEAARIAAAPIPLGDMGQLTRLHAGWYRALRDVTIDLARPDGDLTVVVGPNQAGKSTILDALDLLSSAARGELRRAIFEKRGGFRSLLYRGDGPPGFELFAEVRIHGRDFRYGFGLEPIGHIDYIVGFEELRERSDGKWGSPLLQIRAGKGELRGTPFRLEAGHELFLTAAEAQPIPELLAVRAALTSVSIHPYFRTGAGWADPTSVPMRAPARMQPGQNLDPVGDNLVAALFALQERSADWEQLRDLARLAFPRLDHLRFLPATGDYLSLRWIEKDPPAEFDIGELSDGTLHFLACACALLQPHRTLIAIDEPERHLHPEALRRLVAAAQSLSVRTPILFTTQSDRLLSFLDESPGSIVIAGRGDRGTELVRPDPAMLSDWLRDFSLGEIRPELETWGRDA